MTRSGPFWWLVAGCVSLCACGAFGGTDASSEDGGSVGATGDASTYDARNDGSLNSGGDGALGSDAAASVVDAGACEGGTLYSHSAGPGDAGWTDCTPLGTHTPDEAMKACQAYTGGVFGTCNVKALCASGSCPPGCSSQVTAYYGLRGWKLDGTITQYDGSTMCYADGVWN